MTNKRIHGLYLIMSLVVITAMVFMAVGCNNSNGNNETSKGSVSLSDDAAVTVTADGTPTGTVIGGTDNSEIDDRDESENVTDADDIGENTVIAGETKSPSEIAGGKESAESGNKSPGSHTENMTTSGTSKSTDKNNGNVVTTTTKPLIQVLPDGGLLLPDDVWE